MVVELAAGSDVATVYLRWRLVVLVREAAGPVPARVLLRNLAPGYRPEGPAASAQVDAELELLAASGVPVVSEPGPGGATYWRWDPPDSPRFDAVQFFWPVVCERASRGWRRRDARPIRWALAVAAGELEEMEGDG